MRMTPLRWVSAALLGIALPAMLLAPVPDYSFEALYRNELTPMRFSDWSAVANIRIASQRSGTLRNRYFAERAAALAKEPVAVGAGSSPSFVRDARIELFKRPHTDRNVPFASVVLVRLNDDRGPLFASTPSRVRYTCQNNVSALDLHGWWS